MTDSLSIQQQVFNMSPIGTYMATGQLPGVMNQNNSNNVFTSKEALDDANRKQWQEYMDSLALNNPTDGAKKEKVGFWKRVTGGKDITMEEYEKLPGWKKLIRQTGNVLAGAWNVAERFAGYENGKMNWGKFAKNMAIAAGVTALCCIPVVGPILSTSLLVVGVGAGTIGVVKGAKKASQATTVAEKDKGWQEIGTGATIGISSAMGLRAKGKAFRLSDTTGTTATSSSRVGQWVQDACINSMKATKSAVTADITAINAAGGGVKGYAQVTKQNVSNAWNKCTSKENFDKSMAEAKQGLDKKIADLEANTSRSPLQDAELQSLKNQRGMLDSVKTRQDWKNFRDKAGDATDDLKFLDDALKNIDDAGMVEINGVKVKATEVKEAMVKIAEQKVSFGDQAANLYSQRVQSMKDMSFFRSRKYKDDLSEFVGGDKNFNFQYGTDIRWTAFKDGFKWYQVVTKPIGLAFETIGLPVKLATHFQQSGANAIDNITQVANPFYVPSFWDMVADMGSMFAPKAAEQGAEAVEQAVDATQVATTGAQAVQAATATA